MYVTIYAYRMSGNKHHLLSLQTAKYYICCVHACVWDRFKRRFTCSGWGGRSGAMASCHQQQRAARWTRPSSGDLTCLHPLLTGPLLVKHLCTLPLAVYHATSKPEFNACVFIPKCIMGCFTGCTSLARTKVNFLAERDSAFKTDPTNFICIFNWTLWQQFLKGQPTDFLGGLTSQI